MATTINLENHSNFHYSIDNRNTAQIIFAQGGQDAIQLADGNNTIFGGREADVLTGLRGDNILYGKGGSDRLAGSVDRILKYVYQFYFPLHDLSTRDILAFSPVFEFVEATIYQADSLMEQGQNSKLITNDNSNSLTQLKMSLIEFLKQNNLFDMRIARELAKGEEYIKVENQLMRSETIKEEEIIKAAELRSSDVRLIHCLLFRLLNKAYDEQLLSLIWSLEVIVDINEDLLDYEEDVKQDRYNTYRWFVKLYQQDAPKQLQDLLASYETIFWEQLANFSLEIKQFLTLMYEQFKRYFSIAIPQPIIE